MTTRSWMRPPALTALVALAGACGQEASDEGVVARVDDYELTVDETVELLVDEERLAPDAGVVESLAGLWIDYTLLAEAAATDTTFAGLDLEPLVMRQVEQMMVFQLRDSVIQVDTFVTDDELRARYEEEEPEVQLRASHIMLRLPIGAGQAARDSVRQELEALRQRILEGADFAALAREHSQDPGTAAAGGDLGYFGRGEMVAPFEEAAMALAPGEVSDIVQTPMGLHVIRLTERRMQSFEAAAPRFREQVRGRMVQEAESAFVSGLVDEVEPRVTEGAAEVVRELATNPGADVTLRAARRALVEWEGGSLTVGEVRLLLQMEPPQLRSQVAQGADELIEDFLQSLARREVLIREAEAAGLRPQADSIDALVDDARGQLLSAARRLGFLDLDRAPGEALEIAVQRAVQEALEDVLSGATQEVPLGLVRFQLREGRSSVVLGDGVGEAILRIAEIRATRDLAPAEAPATLPDTAG